MGPKKEESKKESFISYFIIIIIIIYQKLFSPLIGQNCRFIPSCSNYSILAIKRYGLIKGIFISARRICKCNPWNRGGYDPVP